MKIAILGDTHGRSIWKKIVLDKSYDKIIFIGDYFDSKNGHSANRQIANFKEILEFKRANKDKVILLIGNHDFHYMTGVDESYSGYQNKYAKDINKVLDEVLAEELMQMCYSYDNLLFSHAGVTKTWVKQNSIDESNLVSSINNLFKTDKSSFKFCMGSNFSRSGEDITQPPIWVRPASLLKDGIDNYKQIVGHTSVTNILVLESLPIILIDALGTSEEYLVYEDSKFTIMKTKE